MSELTLRQKDIYSISVDHLFLSLQNIIFFINKLCLYHLHTLKRMYYILSHELPKREKVTLRLLKLHLYMLYTTHVSSWSRSLNAIRSTSCCSCINGVTLNPFEGEKMRLVAEPISLLVLECTFR